MVVCRDQGQGEDEERDEGEHRALFMNERREQERVGAEARRQTQGAGVKPLLQFYSRMCGSVSHHWLAITITPIASQSTSILCLVPLLGLFSAPAIVGVLGGVLTPVDVLLHVALAVPDDVLVASTA